MAIEVFMPRLTHDMTHGVFVKWLKEDGESVEEGEPIFEVETDKAITEVVAEANGMIGGIQFKEGDRVPVGTLVGYILSEGEALPAIQDVKVSNRESPAELKPPLRKYEKRSIPKKGVFKESSVIASPVAKRIARDHNIDLRILTGTGPGARIVEADVRNFLSNSLAPDPTSNVELQEAPFEKVPLTHIQRKTGERLVRSVQSAPHFVLEVDVNLTEACRLRDLFNTQNEQTLSYTAVFVKAVANALQKNPAVNVSFQGDHVRRYKEVNIGVAIATSAGLLVPVIHKVDGLTLSQINQIMKNLQGQAESSHISSECLSGGTFTISNLGMFGVDRFQAIINPPEAAILAIGRIIEIPWQTVNGFEMRSTVNMRLSIDHRAIDGATAAPFLNEVRKLLENPDSLFQMG